MSLATYKNFIVTKPTALALHVVEHSLTQSVQQFLHALSNGILNGKPQLLSDFLKADPVVARIRAVLLVFHFAFGNLAHDLVNNHLFGAVIQFSTDIKYFEVHTIRLGCKHTTYGF